MASNRLDILLSVNDKASGKLRDAENNVKKFSKTSKANFVEIAAKAFLVVQGFKAIAGATTAFVEAASKVEQLRTRLKVLTGSIEEGNVLFEEMAMLASRVPQTYDEIMESATQLRAVVRGGNEEVIKLMPIIADLAAATGISVRDTTSQMIRMYSAGAASADMFRERGVLAMLGFQAGVSVSAEETMQRVVAAWEDGGSKFRGATKELATTWVGQVSMMEDAWFKFRQQLGEFLTESPLIVEGIENITYALKFWADVIDGFQTKNLSNDLTGDLLRNLDMVNDALDREREALANNLFGDREAQLQRINDLLTQRSRLLLTIHEQKARNNEIDLEEIKVTKKLGEMQDAHIKATIEARKKQSQDTAKTFVETMEIVGKFSKEAAMALKVVKTGEAIISTHSAVTKALDTPPPGNFVLAAITLAKGLAEVAAIQAVGFAKGTDSVPSMLTPGEMVVPRSFADAIRAGDLTLGGGGGGDITINIIQPSIGSDGGSIEDFAEELGFEVERALKTAGGI